MNPTMRRSLLLLLLWAEGSHSFQPTPAKTHRSSTNSQLQAVSFQDILSTVDPSTIASLAIVGLTGTLALKYKLEERERLRVEDAAVEEVATVTEADTAKVEAVMEAASEHEIAQDKQQVPVVEASLKKDLVAKTSFDNDNVKVVAAEVRENGVAEKQAALVVEKDDGDKIDKGLLESFMEKAAANKEASASTVSKSRSADSLKAEVTGKESTTVTSLPTSVEETQHEEVVVSAAAATTTTTTVTTTEKPSTEPVESSKREEPLLMTILDTSKDSKVAEKVTEEDGATESLRQYMQDKAREQTRQRMNQRKEERSRSSAQTTLLEAVAPPKVDETTATKPNTDVTVPAAENGAKLPEFYAPPPAVEDAEDTATDDETEETTQVAKPAKNKNKKNPIIRSLSKNKMPILVGAVALAVGKRVVSVMVGRGML